MSDAAFFPFMYCTVAREQWRHRFQTIFPSFQTWQLSTNHMGISPPLVMCLIFPDKQLKFSQIPLGVRESPSPGAQSQDLFFSK